MKDEDVILGIISVFVVGFILGVWTGIVYKSKDSSKSARTSKPRCKCGTANCNDSNCDPGM